MRLILYVILCLLFAPFMFIAMFAYLIPIIIRRGKVSGTTYEPFSARLLAHLAGVRDDPATLQLASALPATNPITMWLMIRPLVWASEISGYIPVMIREPVEHPLNLMSLIAARNEFIDQALADSVESGDQVVILGAGWDTRGWGFLKERGARVFEVDAPGTQAAKIEAVEKCGLDPSGVTFVTCDFLETNWLDAIKAAGFSDQAKAFILWEGVTMYLDQAANRETFDLVGSLPAGSRVACDFMGDEWLNGTILGKLTKFGAWSAYGEPFRAGLPIEPEFESALQAYLQASGLTLERAWRFGRKEPFAGLLLAVK